MLYYVWIYFLFSFFFMSTVYCKGCVQLDTYTFKKVVNKFEASLIKFDTAYPFGAKHDAFEAVCEAAHMSPELLVGEVPIKDYGEKDNEDLAKYFGIKNEDFPVVKLFIRGRDEPINFTATSDAEFTTNNLKKFIRSHYDVYIGSPGCLENYDKLVKQFISAKDSERKKLLADGEEMLKNTKEIREKKSAETYVKIMKKIVEKGPGFVTSEVTRVENILKGKLSDEKQNLMQERVNILQSFMKHDEL